MGVLHYTYQEVMRTPVFLGMAAVQIHYDAQEKKDQAEWERLRILGAWVIAPHSKKNADVTPKKILPLPWDVQSVDIDSQRAMIKRIQEQGIKLKKA